jgi:broad specificity phosphatase PhoE
MTIYLVRHAKAGDRDSWVGDDELRPLSGRGHLQARGLIDVLADARFERLISSPYVRCMETVVPLATVRRMAVEPADALAEGASLDEALALVRKHSGNGAVMCTHGDVMPMLLDYYAAHGVDIGPAPQWPKGCTWVLDTDATGEVRAARYLPPPVG